MQIVKAKDDVQLHTRFYWAIMTMHLFSGVDTWSGYIADYAKALYPENRKDDAAERVSDEVAVTQVNDLQSIPGLLERRECLWMQLGSSPMNHKEIEPEAHKTYPFGLRVFIRKDNGYSEVTGLFVNFFYSAYRTVLISKKNQMRAIGENDRARVGIRHEHFRGISQQIAKIYKESIGDYLCKQFLLRSCTNWMLQNPYPLKNKEDPSKTIPLLGWPDNWGNNMGGQTADLMRVFSPIPLKERKKIISYFTTCNNQVYHFQSMKNVFLPCSEISKTLAELSRDWFTDIKDEKERGKLIQNEQDHVWVKYVDETDGGDKVAKVSVDGKRILDDKEQGAMANVKRFAPFVRQYYRTRGSELEETGDDRLTSDEDVGKHTFFVDNVDVFIPHHLTQFVNALKLSESLYNVDDINCRLLRLMYMIPLLSGVRSDEGSKIEVMSQTLSNGDPNELFPSTELYETICEVWRNSEAGENALDLQNTQVTTALFETIKLTKRLKNKKIQADKKLKIEKKIEATLNDIHDRVQEILNLLPQFFMDVCQTIPKTNNDDIVNECLVNFRQSLQAFVGYFQMAQYAKFASDQPSSFFKAPEVPGEVVNDMGVHDTPVIHKTKAKNDNGRFKTLPAWDPEAPEIYDKCLKRLRTQKYHDPSDENKVKLLEMQIKKESYLLDVCQKYITTVMSQGKSDVKKRVVQMWNDVQKDENPREQTEMTNEYCVYEVLYVMFVANIERSLFIRELKKLGGYKGNSTFKNHVHAIYNKPGEHTKSVDDSDSDEDDPMLYDNPYIVLYNRTIFTSSVAEYEELKEKYTEMSTNDQSEDFKEIKEIVDAAFESLFECRKIDTDPDMKPFVMTVENQLGSGYTFFDIKPNPAEDLKIGNVDTPPDTTEAVEQPETAVEQPETAEPEAVEQPETAEPEAVEQPETADPWKNLTTTPNIPTDFNWEELELYHQRVTQLKYIYDNTEAMLDGRQLCLMKIKKHSYILDVCQKFITTVISANNFFVRSAISRIWNDIINHNSVGPDKLDTQSTVVYRVFKTMKVSCDERDKLIESMKMYQYDFKNLIVENWRKTFDNEPDQSKLQRYVELYNDIVFVSSVKTYRQLQKEWIRLRPLNTETNSFNHNIMQIFDSLLRLRQVDTSDIDMKPFVMTIENQLGVEYTHYDMKPNLAIDLGSYGNTTPIDPTLPEKDGGYSLEKVLHMHFGIRLGQNTNSQHALLCKSFDRILSLASCDDPETPKKSAPPPPTPPPLEPPLEPYKSGEPCKRPEPLAPRRLGLVL